MEENIQKKSYLVYKIKIDNIVENREQPRIKFDDEQIEELKNSILEHGLLQPILLRQLRFNKYEIIAGERRFRACKLAGFNEIEAIIKNLNSEKSGILALIENIQRENLTSIEEAKSYKSLLEKFNKSQKELSNLLNITQSNLANKLRLLSLSDEIQLAILKKKIGERHGRALLRIKDLDKRNKIFKEILINNYTVAQTEKIINKFLNKKEKNKNKIYRYASNNILVANTINKTIKIIEEFGFNIDSKKKENDKEIIYEIKVLKR